jgi:hypothetical protein
LRCCQHGNSKPATDGDPALLQCEHSLGRIPVRFREGRKIAYSGSAGKSTGMFGFGAILVQYWDELRLCAGTLYREPGIRFGVMLARR